MALFDGPEQPGIASRYGLLEVVWSGAHSADDEIARRAAARPHDWIVVTDDGELGSRCRELGARVDPAAFLLAGASRAASAASRERLLSGGEKPAGTAAELAHWRQVFGSVEE